MHRLLSRSLSVLAPATLFAFLMALGLAACGSDGDATADEAVEDTADADANADEAVEDTTDGDATADETVEDTADAADSETDDAEAAAEAEADSDDAGEAGDAGSDAGGDVSLAEWAVNAPTTYQAGEVSFVATNDGNFPHELAIARGDSYDTLPQTSTGAVDEDTLATDFLGRTERISPGQSATLTLELEPGNYVIFCNLGSGPSSHAANGQVLSITVEG